MILHDLPYITPLCEDSIHCKIVSNYSIGKLTGCCHQCVCMYVGTVVFKCGTCAHKVVNILPSWEIGSAT